MNTTCCKTGFPHRRNNVIDFCAYRDRILGRQAAAAGNELTFHWEIDESVWTGGTPRRQRKPVAKTPQPRPIRAKQGKKKSSEQMDRLCLLSSLAIVSVVWLLILL